MNKKITLRHLSAHESPVIEEHANKQLEKIEHFLSSERDPIYIELTAEPAKIHAHHRVEILVKTPNYDLFTHDEGPDFYQAMSNAIDKMYDSLCKRKDRLVEDRKMVGRHEEFKKQR
jgi:ribosomal subunit interface protein